MIQAMATKTPHLSQRERWALADLLAELGPDVPTLCEGWRSADLAAHVVVRERRPDSVPGMFLGFAPLVHWTDRARDAVRDTMSWGALLARLRSGPPALVRPVDRWFNTLEFFVHHEDLRRAQPGWQPRPLAPEDEAELWRFAKLAAFGHGDRAARLEAPGLAPLTLSKKGGGPVVRGPAGELVLWLMGRTGAAQVELEAS